jgi:hypothetical protein
MGDPIYCLSVRLDADDQADLELVMASWQQTRSDVVRTLIASAAATLRASRADGNAGKVRQLRLPWVPK